jgi:polyisoprenoid-binding protein YceI
MTASTTATTPTTPIAARTYAIDKAHSELVFQVRHLVTRVRGRFTGFEGKVHLDPVAPEKSSVTVSIDAATIDTGTADRDAHLRSDDFFAVGTYPALSFTSTRVTKKSDELFEVSGTLTIRGVAKDVTLPVTFLGAARDPWGNDRVGFETEIAINRKDFGLTWNAALETGGFLVGDEVKISASVQAIAQ